VQQHDPIARPDIDIAMEVSSTGTLFPIGDIFRGDRGERYIGTPFQIVQKRA
jgi:hypothetical protein